MSASPRGRESSDAIAYPSGMSALALTSVLLLASAPGARADDSRSSEANGVVAELERAAHPLRSVQHKARSTDLRPLGRMIGRDSVVAMGEATHASREFVTLKSRAFRYLVREKGFRTYAQEVSWATGVRLDRYVTRGVGNPRRIIEAEFVTNYELFASEELLRTVEWMRTYNQRHRRSLRFIGSDLAYPGPVLFRRVAAYARAERPDLAGRLSRLYHGLRPRPGVSAEAYMRRLQTLPLERRRELADRARTALRLLHRAAGPQDSPAAVVHYARAILQSAEAYAIEDFAARMRFRDGSMARNVAWWHRHHTGKTFVAASNGHVAYTSEDPELFPKTQAAFLRELLGNRFLSIGTTFDHGGFRARRTDPTGPVARFRVGPAPAGYNEHTLDRVAADDFYLDLREIRQPARKWLSQSRPTRFIGLTYPAPDAHRTLRGSYDVLVHLSRITATHPLR